VWLRESQGTWRRSREVGKSGRGQQEGCCLKWRRRGENCSGADKRGVAGKFFKESIGKVVSGSGVCKETHGISAWCATVNDSQRDQRDQESQ